MNKKHLLIIGISALILIFIIQSASATWVNTSFTKRAPILINNTGNATNLTYYQVFLNYSYDSDMQTNFNDSRIYNQTHFDLYGNETNSTISFWNESISSGNWSNIWGNYTYLAASSWTNDTYYMYYKNPSASSVSNGTNTFDAWFDKNSTSGWTTGGGLTVTTSGEYLRFYEPGVDLGLATHSVSSPVNKWILETRFHTISQAGDDSGLIITRDGTDQFSASTAPSWLDQGKWDIFPWSVYPGAYTEGTEYIMQHKIDEGDSSTGVDYRLYDVNRVLQSSATGKAFVSGSPTNLDNLYLGTAGSSEPIDLYCKWIIFRKYASPEPNSLLGAEESYGVGTTPSVSNVATGSINVTSQWVDWDVNQTAHNRWKYSIYSNMSSSSWSSWQNNTNAPNITVTTLTENTKYYYQAWSHNSTNTSLTDNSTTANFTTPAAGTPPSLSNQSPSTPVTTRYGASITFNATSNQSSNNSWMINNTIVEWDNGTTSPSYTNTTGKIGTWNVTLTAHNSINLSLTNSTSWIWTVAFTASPTIVDGVYGILNTSIPSNATILDYKNESILTIESTLDWDNIDSTTWNSYKASVTYCYDELLRSAIRIDCGGDYDSAYDDLVKANITTYFPDLLIDPYLIDVQYIVINLTNTGELDADKIAFVNNIAFNISEQTSNKFKIVVLEDLAGLDDAYVSKTPIIYITLTDVPSWIDDETVTLRGNTTLSRVYTGNESLLSNVYDHKTKIINKMRSRTNTTQYAESYSVNLINNDVALYNNGSTSVNRTIANANAGYYWDLHNDTMVNLSQGGTLGFWIYSYSYAYCVDETSLDKIMYITNETSQLWGATTTTEDEQKWNDGIKDSSSTFAGANLDYRAEFYDPSYTKENTFMIHYEWINASKVTNYTVFDYIIIADHNSNEIWNTINRNDSTYGYIAVSDYTNDDAWQTAKQAEIDDWIDNYNISVFMDGLDIPADQTNMSTRIKVLVDHIRIEKSKKVIMNTYTLYENFSIYGDAVMKESCFARWHGVGAEVDNPIYSWEDMDIEKERADFYTSHNISVLGMPFGNLTDYDKQAYCYAAFAVLYGFSSDNSFKYGQPNFQTQEEIRVYDLGTMLEPSYTETSATDWNRLYQAGRIHINPVTHTWWIDDNKEINNISVDFYFYSALEGSGDRNVSIFSNTNDTIHTIPYTAADVALIGNWVWRTVYLNTSEFETHGHYYIYAYSRPTAGGWTDIAVATSSEGAKTWYDTSAVNLPTNWTGQAWTSHTGGVNNYMINFTLNYTTSKYLDDLTNRINQSRSARVSGNTTITLNGTRDNAIPLWSSTLDLITVPTAKVYANDSAGNWQELNVSTVSNASSSVIAWNYTTVDGEEWAAVRELLGTNSYRYRFLVPHTSVLEILAEENVPPVLAAIGNKNVVVYDWLNFTVTATDANSDPLTYSDNSSLFTINISTGNVNYSALRGEGGNYSVDFGVSDGQSGTDNETIILIVISNIYAYINEWILLNDWATNQTFAQIDANLTNDISYTYYNGTEWLSYQPGYLFNNDTVIPKNESVLVFFNASITIKRTVNTNNISVIGGRWFFMYLPDYTAKNLTSINASMALDSGDVWEMYGWDNSSASYNSSGSFVINPHEGILIYANNSFDWDNR